MTAVAINSDVGEGFGVWTFGTDDEILPYISAANVACGFHAGDPTTIRRICETAANRGVSIGAQVSYRDLVGFGRRFIDMDREDLVNDILYQIGALQIFAQLCGSTISYVKAHGALYNVAAVNSLHASALVDAVAASGRSMPILCQPGTEVWSLASERGMRPLAEAFADRAYTAEGLLVSRGVAGAVLSEPQEIADRVLRMVEDASVVAITGETVRLESPPAAICIHSDTPGAASIAQHVRSALIASGVSIHGLE